MPSNTIHSPNTENAYTLEKDTCGSPEAVTKPLEKSEIYSESGEHRICVVHLVRYKNGIETFRAFINAYRTNPGGIPHDLLLIFKGFPRKDAGEYMRILGSLPCKIVFVRDFGFDIRPYFKIARKFDYQYFCFMNSYSRPDDHDWLLKLYRGLNQPGVGVAGTTGSYQSHSSVCLRMLWSNFYRLPLLVRLVCNLIFKPDSSACPPPGADDQKPSLFTETYQFICSELIASLTLFLHIFKGLWIIARHPQRTPAVFALGWSEVLARRSIFRIWEYMGRFITTGTFMLHVLRYPAFPNYHLRTNGFMISRKVMRKIHPGLIFTKMDAWKFESGKNGFTRQVMKMGLRPIVVGKNGKSYEKENWHISKTHFCINSENLLIKDNQSEMFATAPVVRQQQIMLDCWGPKLNELNLNFR